MDRSHRRWLRRFRLVKLVLFVVLVWLVYLLLNLTWRRSGQMWWTPSRSERDVIEPRRKSDPKVPRPSKGRDRERRAERVRVEEEVTFRRNPVEVRRLRRGVGGGRRLKVELWIEGSWVHLRPILVGGEGRKDLGERRLSLEEFRRLFDDPLYRRGDYVLRLRGQELVYMYEGVMGVLDRNLERGFAEGGGARSSLKVEMEGFESWQEGKKE